MVAFARTRWPARGDAHRFACRDASFSVTALVRGHADDAMLGQVAERYVYEPYGAVTVYNGGGDMYFQERTDWSLDSDNTSDWGNTVLYCGYRFDPETGLYHVRHRVLHPTLGRWTSRDPILADAAPHSRRLGIALADDRKTRTPHATRSDRTGPPWEYKSFRAEHGAQVDHLLLRGVGDLYQYVTSAPMGWTDPRGLERYLIRSGALHFALIIPWWDRDCCGVEQWWRYDFCPWFPDPDRKTTAGVGLQIANWIPSIMGCGGSRVFRSPAGKPHVYLVRYESTCEEDKRLIGYLDQYSFGHNWEPYSALTWNCLFWSHFNGMRFHAEEPLGTPGLAPDWDPLRDVDYYP